MGVKIKVGNSLEVRNPASGCNASYIHRETTWMRVCCGFVVCSIGLWLGCQPPVPGIRSPGDHALELQPSLNYNRDLFASCGRNCPRNFSYHDSCWDPFLGVTDQPNQVSSNKYGSLSGTSNKICHYMQFDFSRSFIRNLAPATTNLKSVNTSVSSVYQRALDGAGRLSPGSQGESVDPYYDTHHNPAGSGLRAPGPITDVPDLSVKEVVALVSTFKVPGIGTQRSITWNAAIDYLNRKELEFMDMIGQAEVLSMSTECEFLPYCYKIAGNNSRATPIKLAGTKYKLQKIGVPSLSDKEIVAITCTLGAAALSGVVSLLVFLHCRNQQRIRDQHKAFLISIESPIPDIPIVDPLRAISQEGQNAIEMAAMNPEPRVQPAE